MKTITFTLDIGELDELLSLCKANFLYALRMKLERIRFPREADKTAVQP